MTGPVAGFRQRGDSRADISYIDDGTDSHRLDLYLPADSAPGQPLPVVVYLHGGGWMTGDKSWLRDGGELPCLTSMLLSSGYALAAVNYRLSGVARYPAPVDDVAAALWYLRENALELGLDPRRIAVAGDSAGGHLALLSAFTDTGSANGRPGAFPPVRAVISYYGVTDLTTVLGQRRARIEAGLEIRGAMPPDGIPVTPPTPEGMMLGAEPDSAAGATLAAEASPLTWVSSGSPATLLVHGRVDGIVPVEQATVLHAKLLAAGIPAELIVIDAGHAEAAFFTDPAIQSRVIDFLSTHLARSWAEDGADKRPARLSEEGLT